MRPFPQNRPAIRSFGSRVGARPVVELVLLLVSAALMAGCASRASHESESTFVVGGGNPETLSNVTVLADPSFTAATLEVAMDQIAASKAPALGTLRSPANSAMQALPGVQKLGRRAIVAVTEYRNWLWFATDVTVDESAKAVTAFRGGYAVQKGSTKVVRWGGSQ